MSQTKRGNTYTRITTLRGIDLTTATEVVVTVKPHGRAAWNFNRDHISLTSDSTDTKKTGDKINELKNALTTIEQQITTILN